MTGDELVRGISVTMLAPTFSERILLVPFEQLETPDVAQITLTDSVSDIRYFTPGGSKSVALILFLHAHVSSSGVENWMLSAARSSSGLRRMISTADGGATKLAFRRLNWSSI